MRLTSDQRLSYEEKGFLVVEDAVPAERVADMRGRLEELCACWDAEEGRRAHAQQEAEIAGAATEARSGQAVRKFSELVPIEPAFRAHAEDPALLDMVEDLIGAPISLYADQALLKPPLVGSAKLPHQDNAYFRVDPASAVITCWCALDDATIENGCMHYLAGSHRAGLVEHEEIPGTPHLVPRAYDPADATPAPVRAGGVIFHHSLTLHHSPPNDTPHWRRAFVCHFVRSDARIPSRAPDTLLRLR